MALSAASDVRETRKPIPPCGACRQSISEYEMKQDSGIVIFFMGNTGEVYRTESVKNLLPLSFDKNLL
jgi:cytidine deaminase